MDLKRKILGVAMAAAMFVPAAAFAHDWGVHHHSASCTHGPMPAARPGGHYEVRTVQTWVDGRWVQDYVPERCVTRHKGRHGRRTVTSCTPAHYMKRWVDGHYENREEWVFVPDPVPSRAYPTGQVTVNGPYWQATARW
ncbi:MAG: hypothetical protein IRZ16_04500 [Myxococcaceae bacterium]|nr:hypothetical protein [Myxococcaceae bacterium]